MPELDLSLEEDDRQHIRQVRGTTSAGGQVGALRGDGRRAANRPSPACSIEVEKVEDSGATVWFDAIRIAEKTE